MKNTNTSRLAFCGAAFAFVVTMLTATLPTPLYPIWQQRYGFSQLVITFIFAAYAVGVIAALVLAGSWSDQLGRRRMLGTGLVFAALSSILFLIFSGIGGFIAARVASGVAAGVFTGTATAAVVELAPPVWSKNATFVATACNMLGLGLGPLVAGLLVQYAPWPVHLPFAVDLLLLTLGGAGVWYAPETVDMPEHPRLRPQRLSLPGAVRPIFVPAVIAGFAGFAVLGLFTALLPAVMGQVLGYSNLALIGAVVFLLFAASTAGQLAQGKLPERSRLPLGCALLAAGSVLLGVAVGLASLAWLLAGSVIAGSGQGMSFRAGMGLISSASPADRRGEVISTFFVVLYVAISVPIIGVGFVATRLGLATAGVIFSAAAGVLALAALLALLWRPRTR